MWAAVIASVSTVMPIVLFMAGLARVGPSTASIASTIEPPFTVALAWIVFGETLGPLQLVGGAFVLSAVVLLQLRERADHAPMADGANVNCGWVGVSAATKRPGSAHGNVGRMSSQPPYGCARRLEHSSLPSRR